MSNRSHELKVWPEYFKAILDGSKQFEVREDDRHFCVGDDVVLKEFDPAIFATHQFHYPQEAEDEAYTGRALLALITYVLRDGQFGLPEKLCVFGFRVERESDLRRAQTPRGSS